MSNGSLTTTLVLAASFLVARYAGWEHLLSAAFGFTLTRVFAVSRLRPDRASRERGA